MKQKTGISFFQKYLTVWVLLCMAAGIVIGHFIPVVPEALGRMEIAGISIPIAILIWIMIYPMMIKVDFQSVKEVGKNPKGLFLTWIVNWVIKPFTMYGFASLFLRIWRHSIWPVRCCLERLHAQQWFLCGAHW